MRRASLLGIAFCSLLAGCHVPQPAGTPSRGLPESGDFSVYELPGSWRDASGAPRELGSLGGKVRVVALVYTHCANTCPQVIADFKQLEARLSTEARERTGFVLVS